MKKRNISSKNNIPSGFYKKILQSMPICCVDMVLKSSNKIYLFKRTYEPVKGEWWFLGGRVFKGESLKDAVLRKAKSEAGIDVKIKKQIGTYESFFNKNRFSTKKNRNSTHSIAVCYLVEPKTKNFKLKLNDEHTDYMTITKIGNDLHPYVRQILRDVNGV